MALYQVSWRADYEFAALMAMCLFLVSGQLWEMYRPSPDVRLLDKTRHSLVFSWLSVVLALLLIGYGSGVSERYAAPVMIAWFAATPVVLSAWRVGLKLMLRLLRHSGYGTQSVAIAGAGLLGQSLAQKIKDSPWDGLSLLGLFDERQPVVGEAALRGDIPFCGDFDALLELSERGAVDRVYIALPMQAEPRIRDLTEKLADLPVAVHMVLDSFAFGLLRGSLHSLGDISTLSIFDTPLNGPGAGLKRIADLVLSAIILCLAAGPMAAIAAGVRISSPGPVIFKQRRSGLDGSEVVVWKFRTMTVTEDGDNIVQARAEDPRVTPFGAFLRRTFLDELPQFINVLQGHLSIVGPRPHAIAHNEKYRRLIPFYMLRHRVKPGITGWAQVNGFRGETEQLSKMEGRVERDLWYIRNWTPWLDLKIILLTAVQVFQGLLPRGHWVSWTRSGTAGPAAARPAIAPSVLLLVENLPVPLDRRVWLEARSLRERGYRVSVVCPRMYGHTVAYEQRDGVHIYRFPLWFEASGLIGYVLEYGSALAFMLWYALRVWMKTGVDVIHVANPPDLLAFVALPFKLCGKKVIYDQHDLCPELFAAKGQGGPRLHRLLLALERISYRLADAVVVPNHSYRDIALGRGKKAETDVFVVRNGPLRDALAPKPSGPLQPLIGYVGVMGDQDGVDLLLEVAAKLKGRYPELRWVLLGDGTHRPYCEAYAKELGVDDRVTFTGMVDEKRIAAELAPCRLCVVPDRVNDFTARSTMNKVMEYMALEKPSVQFDTPEGRYSACSASLYANPNDVDDFADKVAELLDDPARARKMGALGRARFLHSLHWAESVKVLYRAYDHVLKLEKSVQLVSHPRSVGEFSEEQSREQRPGQEFDLAGTAPREAAEAQGAVRRTTGPAVLRIGTELAAASE